MALALTNRTLVPRAQRLSALSRGHRRSLKSSFKNKQGQVCIVRAEGSSGSNDDDQLGDLFKKELEKRNIQSIDDIKDSSQQQSVIAPPSFVTDNPFEDDSQLERSRNLNSEGLEGLIPRGSQLLQLGGSFFLAFGPFILFVLLSFGAVYSVFGDLFVHQGSPSSGVPQYIDPMDLLSEPTVDPMIPM